MRAALWLAAPLSLIALASCGSATRRADGIDVSTLPEDQRADYAVFAERCSSCHSLSRPLESGIDDDAFWIAYVAKMRRMPSSGISPEDTVPILRFLHRYSERQRAMKEHRGDAGAALEPKASP